MSRKRDACLINDAVVSNEEALNRYRNENAYPVAADSDPANDPVAADSDPANVPVAPDNDPVNDPLAADSDPAKDPVAADSDPANVPVAPDNDPANVAPDPIVAIPATVSAPLIYTELPTYARPNVLDPCAPSNQKPGPVLVPIVCP